MTTFSSSKVTKLLFGKSQNIGSDTQGPPKRGSRGTIIPLKIEKQVQEEFSKWGKGDFLGPIDYEIFPTKFFLKTYDKHLKKPMRNDDMTNEE